MYTLALFGTPIGGAELLVLAVLGLLIFGKRLPEVGKSLGKGIVEFKRGLSGVEDEMENAGRAPAIPAPPAVSRQLPSQGPEAASYAAPNHQPTTAAQTARETETPAAPVPGRES